MIYGTLQNRLLITGTVLIALMLELLPLPSLVIWSRPEWVLLTLLYWVMALPHIGFFSVFTVGILLDLSNGTLLGEHALALIIVSYFVIKFHQLIRIYPATQQMLIMFILVIIYKLIIFIIQGFINQLPNVFLYWLSAFSSALLWPWIFILLRDFRRRFGIV
jgi:rod shape-determining protein MreD